MALDLTTPEAVGFAARGMADRIREHDPDIRIAGFTIQPMVRHAGAIELIAGISEDAQFGPVVLFGRGGREVESEGDRALALPPLNLGLARRDHRAYPGRPAARGHARPRRRRRRCGRALRW